METGLHPEEEAHTRVFTPGTTGTVGLITLFPEEIEERTGTYVASPPVPLGVPLPVPVGQEGSGAGEGFELVVTVEGAERACAQLAGESSLYVDIKTYPTGSAPSVPLPDHQGRKPKKGKNKDKPREAPHNPTLTSVRLVMVLG